MSHINKRIEITLFLAFFELASSDLIEKKPSLFWKSVANMRALLNPSVERSGVGNHLR